MKKLKSTHMLQAAALAVTLVWSGSALAGDLVDARIDFPFADDNILRDAGEDRKSSPDASFTPPAGVDYDSFVHLGLYRRIDLGEAFVPEAGLYLKLDVANGVIRDDSSYIRMNLFLDGSARKESLYIQLLPIDADRERLGFHREISWGGTDTFPKNFRGSFAPAAKIGYDREQFYAYAAVKTALLRSAAELELDNDTGNTTLFVERTFYGYLGGVGVELGLKGLWFELNGGYFQKGTNNKAEVLGKPVHAFGGSAQLSYASGAKIHRRIDLGLYRQDPQRFDVTKADAPTEELEFRFALEGSFVDQVLADLDNPGSTAHDQAMAGFFSTAFQKSALRLHLDAGLRELSFLTFDVPGFIPNAVLPEGAESSPEMSGIVAVDYTFMNGLTPYTQFGVQMPAVYRGVVPAGQNAATALQGYNRVVVRGTDPGDWDILPEGEEEKMVLSGKGGLRWKYGEDFSILAEVSYKNDPNRALLRKDAYGIAHRVFVDPHIVGIAALASMKF